MVKKPTYGKSELIRIEAKRQKEKISLMTVLLAACCFLTYYFHEVLGIGAIFTHTFYIPITLAALWWKRKGLVVALFLALFLMVADFFFGDYGETAQNSIRSLMFVIIGFVVALLSEKIAKRERCLRESEEKFKNLFDNMNSGVAIYMAENGGEDFIFQDFNKAGEQIDKINKGELIGKSILKIFPDVKNFGLFDVLQRVWKTGHPEHHPIAMYQDDRVTGWRNNFVYKLSSGQIVAIYSDETSRKQAEEALRESEKRIKAILRASPVGIGLFVNRELDWANEMFYHLVGYESGSLIGRDTRVFYPDDETYDQTGRELYEGIQESRTSEVETRWIKVDGTAFDCRIRASSLDPEDSSKGQIVTVTDISETKRLEAQFRQAQKMEAIGTLAGGIAHDFNNILTTILGNAQLALMDVGHNAALREKIEEINTAGERAASLTRQLLTFSRKQTIRPKILDLNELLADIAKMLGRLIGEDVELLTIPGAELWQVETDPGQMEQVIMNLVINARDSMPKGGKLTVETENTNLDRVYFRKHGIKEQQPGPYVMLAVGDTGVGMDKETREHIFEPFFTTKEVGKGTGLGLSTVYGIVKQSNGFIWTYSEPGQGSTFKIYLPKADGDVVSEKKGQHPGEELDGSETVLIVEDDVPLGKLARTILEQRGYKVLEAENGEDALRVSEAHDGLIDLLITDVVMPKMGGKEVAEQLQSLYPQMKVIYTSGYTDDAIVHYGVLATGLNFLEKPFTTEKLVRKVGEILNKE
jgi:two-component system, cell cycle sensor histidine kinase and response regulator CckA